MLQGIILLFFETFQFFGNFLPLEEGRLSKWYNQYMFNGEHG